MTDDYSRSIAFAAVDYGPVMGPLAEPRTRALLNAVLKIGPQPALEFAVDNSRR